MISICRRRTIFLEKVSLKFKEYGGPAIDHCVSKELNNISNNLKLIDSYKPVPSLLYNLYYSSLFSIPLTPFLIYNFPIISIPISTLIFYMGLIPLYKPIIRLEDFQRLRSDLIFYYNEVSNSHLTYVDDLPYFELGNTLYPLHNSNP